MDLTLFDFYGRKRYRARSGIPLGVLYGTQNAVMQHRRDIEKSDKTARKFSDISKHLRFDHNCRTNLINSSTSAGALEHVRSPQSTRKR